MNVMLALGTFGATEILFLFFLAILIFGPKKIPELARSLGRASQEYKKAKEDFLAEVNKPAEDMKDAISTDKPAAPSAPAAAEHKDDSAKS